MQVFQFVFAHRIQVVVYSMNTLAATRQIPLIQAVMVADHISVNIIVEKYGVCGYEHVHTCGIPEFGHVKLVQDRTRVFVIVAKFHEKSEQEGLQYEQNDLIDSEHIFGLQTEQKETAEEADDEIELRNGENNVLEEDGAEAIVHFFVEVVAAIEKELA